MLGRRQSQPLQVCGFQQPGKEMSCYLDFPFPEDYPNYVQILYSWIISNVCKPVQPPGMHSIQGKKGTKHQLKVSKYFLPILCYLSLPWGSINERMNWQDQQCLG